MANLLEGLSPEEKKNLLGTVENRMLWHCRTDPRFCYYVYVPEAKPGVRLSLFVYIHGTARRYETLQYDVYKDFAEKNACAVMFPLFPGGIADESDYNEYKMIAAGGVRYDNVLLAMIGEMCRRYGNIDAESFFMAGHSGGGQFANRFFFLHPERLKAVAIGAPGRPTYLDETADYYWGVRDWQKVFGSSIDYEALKKVPAQLSVGEYDTKFIGQSPYGTNRNERVESLKKNFEAHGIRVEKAIIPATEHVIKSREGFETPCRFFERVMKQED